MSLWKLTRRSWLLSTAAALLLPKQAQAKIRKHGGSSGVALPVGVTLVSIDGGPTYYNSNNFTNAASPINFKSVPYSKGWDSPGFIGVGPWLSPFGTNAIATEWVDLGWNAAFSFSLANYSGNLARFNANGISVFVLYQDLGSILGLEVPGTETIGINVFDEPDSENQAIKLAILGTPQVTFTGAIASGLLTVSAPSSNNILWRYSSGTYNGGPVITGTPVALNPNVTLGGAGTGTGGAGTYGIPNPDVSSESMTQVAMPALTAALQNNLVMWTNFSGASWCKGNGFGSFTNAQLLSNPYGANNRHIDIQTVDIYFFTLANSNDPGNLMQSLSNIYDPSGGSSAMTLPQGARGSHYGDMIDFMRGFQAGQFPAPLSVFIENGNGQTAIAYQVQPQELNWAVWSTIIHGARHVMYFNSDGGSAPSTGGFGGDNMQNPFFTVAQFATFSGSISGSTLTVTGSITGPASNPPSGSPGWIFPGMAATAGVSGSATILQQTNNFGTPGKAATYTISGTAGAQGPVSMTFTQPNIAPNVGGTVIGSMYNQTKSTDALMATMAPVINSQFAKNYVTVSPAGYNHDAGATHNFAFGIQTGIEVMAKYYTGGSYSTSGFNINADSIAPGFYIFACTRNNETDTSISATFTLAAGATASSITVVNESRSLSVTGSGGATPFFTDTFANAWTVHIYKVNP